MENNYYEIIEKLNMDYIGLVTSKEFKLGKYIYTVLNYIKERNLKKAFMEINIRFKHFLVKKHNGKVNRFYEKNNSELSLSKIAVYTVLFGNYDQIYEPLVVDDNCDYYIVTDQKVKENSVWKTIDLNEELKQTIASLSNTEKNRYFKMNVPDFFKNYTYSIYIDSNIEIIGNIRKLVNYICPTTGLAIFNHESRDCIFDEAVVCGILRKAKRTDIKAQIDRYKKEGMPHNFGLCECNVIVAEQTASYKKIMNAWWNDFMISESKRDQLSFPYILWKLGYNINDVGCLGENMSLCPLFRKHYHNKRLGNHF